MLQRDPKSRPDAIKALRHKWITQFVAVKDSDMPTIDVNSLSEFARMSKIKQVGLMLISKQLSNENLEKLKKAFLAMDKDRNGSLTVAEIKDAFKKTNTPIPNELDDLVKSIDVDGTGEIQYLEFLAATIDRKEYSKEDTLWEAFMAFDKNGDGVISPSELRTVLANMKLEFSDEEVDRYMKEIDSSGNNEIEFDEFCTLMRST